MTLKKKKDTNISEKARSGKIFSNIVYILISYPSHKLVRTIVIIKASLDKKNMPN